MRNTILTAAVVLLGGLLADLLLFGSPPTAQAQTTNQVGVGVPDCNNNCRVRQEFKKCGGGSAVGKCYYYEQAVCKHCVGTGSCEASDFADWNTCKPWTNHDVSYYELLDDDCLSRCPCGDTDTTIRQSQGTMIYGTTKLETITTCRYSSDW